MGTVVANASMSLDGYIAKADSSIGLLFDWLQAGDVEVPTASPGITFHLTPTSAAYWREWTAALGVLVCGRTLFDVTDGWGGRHTIDVPVVVVTHEVPTAWVEQHPDAPFTFVTDGVQAAVARAQEIAGPRTVAVTAGTIAAQCLQLGLLDVVAVDLVPGRHGCGSSVLPRPGPGGRGAGRPGGVRPGSARDAPADAGPAVGRAPACSPAHRSQWAWGRPCARAVTSSTQDRDRPGRRCSECGFCVDPETLRTYGRARSAPSADRPLRKGRVEIPRCA